MIWLLACIYLSVAVAVQRQQDIGSDLDTGLIPITVPELLRLLRDTVIPPPRRDQAHRLHWSARRRRRGYRAPSSPPTLECLRRGNTVITTNYSRRN